MQDTRGVWRRAREQQPDTEQERPVLAAHVLDRSAWPAASFTGCRRKHDSLISAEFLTYQMTTPPSI